MGRQILFFPPTLDRQVEYNESVIEHMYQGIIQSVTVSSF